jgi:aerobic C4-dicarboxylate transport protein
MSSMSSSQSSPPPADAAPAAKKDRSHFLYMAVIVAVILGIAVGLIAPDFAVKLKPIGTAFVALIKMMISPVIFCTIVLGVGSVASAAHVGKVGSLALGYFVTMSTVALTIGLVVGNLIHPGSGLNFLLHMIPTTLVSALTDGEVLQTLLVALLIGFAVQAMGRAGKPVIRGVEHIQRVVFRVLAMIMWAAPIGAFGAIAAVVGETGVDALKSLAILMVAFYITCFLFVFVVLGTILKVATGVNVLSLFKYLAREFLLIHGRRGDPDRLLLQPRRHRDLPDDGVAVHRGGARQAVGDR